MKQHAGQGRLGLHAALMAGASAAGFGVAAAVPRTAEARAAAFLGVALAALSGVLALGLKRRALKRNVAAALQVVAVVFGVRALLVMGGLLWVVSRRWDSMPFVVGFLGVYVALQWIEISYVTASPTGADGEE